MNLFKDFVKSFLVVLPLLHFSQSLIVLLEFIGKPEAFLFPMNEKGIPFTVKSARYKFDSILEKADITLPLREYHERGMTVSLK